MADQQIISTTGEVDKDHDAPVNELTEGLAKLNSDLKHYTPTELAQQNKEDGIHFIKLKEYKFAKLSFSQGIKTKCPDNELNAQLYNNRAVAEFYLRNYKASLDDCCRAIKLKPDYMKAIMRGLACAEKLNSWDKMIVLCDKGLQTDSGSEELIKRKRFAEEEKRKLAKNRKLVTEISNRRIRICRESPEQGDEQCPSIAVKYLQPRFQEFNGYEVHLNQTNELVWPVLFLFPEYKIKYFIREFNENTRIIDHLELLFGSRHYPAPWDKESKYKPSNLEVYYEMYSDNILVQINPECTLRNISDNLSDNDMFQVAYGTPAFFFGPKGLNIRQFLKNKQ